MSAYFCTMSRPNSKEFAWSRIASFCNSKDIISPKLNRFPRNSNISSFYFLLKIMFITVIKNLYMKKDSEKLDFGKARGDTVENLRAIRAALARCIEEGMLDVESAYYNQILSFIDQANLSRNWAELEEVI